MLPVDTLQAHAESRADHPALVWPELRLTYGELGERVRQATALLRQRGVRAGDRVAVAMDRTPAAVVLHLATLALGATSVPLAPDAGSSLTETVAKSNPVSTGVAVEMSVADDGATGPSNGA